ncbi:MAG: signal peptidase I [Candidatus Competibacterales bacterium]|nr:signal peptidase I [Candidatus Competibacterales bacterium]
MHFDFAAILVIAALLTGLIWLIDIVVLAPRRAKTASGEQDVTATEGEAGPSKLPWYVDFSRSFFPIILIVLILRSFVAEPFRIPSSSMEPTLLPGDFILVSKFAYGLRLPVLNTKILDLGEPQRGDVVVFRYPEDPSIAYIKRIIGLPGDHIEYRNKRLYINGELVELVPLPTAESASGGAQQLLEVLDEASHRIQLRTRYAGISSEYVVPDEHYFVMGDNRDNSRDSRYWGYLPEANLIGEAFLIWMNWDCVTGNGHCNRIGSTIE